MILRRGGGFDGVGVVDAVDLSPLHDDLGADFHRPERGGCIGRKIGISRPAGEDDDAFFFKMTNGPAANIALGQLAHFDRGLDAGHDANALERVLQG
ncbi:MAG: hypothetical protein JW394_0149 [Nitrospira sp.]|nr:hypothetical protein [Nitrospira sp.]